MSIPCAELILGLLARVLFLSILNTQLRRAVGLPRGCSSLTGTTMVLLGDALGPALVPSETKPSRSETEADLNQINTRPKRHCSLAEARRIQSDREAICARSIPENTVMNPKQTPIENIPTQIKFEANLKRSIPRVIERLAGTDRFQRIS